MSTEKILEVTNLSASYGSIKALNDICFEVMRGEIFSIIGANGAGKTTLLSCLSGILNSTGEILFNNSAVQQASPAERVENGIALVPEGRKIFSKLSVLENLEIGAYLRNDQQGIKSDLERVYNLFPILKERSAQSGGTLSGGEQQMLAIGRALMSKPKLLLMDEPSMGVAPILVEKIFTKIEDLNKEGLTIVLVEQNANRALDLADRAAVIETGRITLRGSGKELKKDPNVQAAYLGA